jgi:CrcB protein
MRAESTTLQPVTNLAGIAFGGALGALARYGLDGFVSRRVSTFPLGTFVINISGSFAIGLLFTLLSDRFHVPPWFRSTLTIGFLGAYTTFSTWTLESYRLLETGAWAMAVANLVGSMAAGLLAVYLGTVAARAL